MTQTTLSNITWITGGSSGIGKSLALKLAAKGEKVAVTARSKDKLADLESQAESLSGSIHAYPGDVTDADKMQEIVKEIEQTIGPIGKAILNAGTYVPDTIDDFTPDNFEHHCRINLIGTANAFAPLIPKMRQRQAGHIAFVASVAGYRGLPRSLSYGPTKAALINMAEALAIETLDEGIKVQVINPGFVETPLTEQNDFDMPFLITSEQAADYILKGLETARFEIGFPWQMVTLLKTIGKLPARWYFRVVKKTTSSQMNKGSKED